jgi:ABC-type antimicrobial peptide transport system permease subunit/AraC-like DNA-binding protein
LKQYAFHITLYDLAFLGTIFIGLTFTLLLWFTRKTNQSANRFLAVVLAVAALWIARILAIDVGLSTYFPNWNRLPLQFSLAFGPLIFFYVLKIIRPDYKFRRRDLLHFSPLLLELAAQVIEIRESIQTGATSYDTLAFQQLNPVLQLLAFISVVIYLYKCRTLIEGFYQQLKFNGADRYRNELQWLNNLLTGFGLVWLFWIPLTVVDYFLYHHQLGIQAYYPLYFFLTTTLIWMAAKAFLRPEPGTSADNTSIIKPLLPADLKQKGIWLRKIVKEKRYYQDPELSLSTLAEKLELTTHELSRIINTVLKKSFNDFINEYRVRDIVDKMQNPAYDHITLLGIAYESGFNSKTTFHRIFKEITGKSPAEYKMELKKDIPSYNLEPRPGIAPVILHRETSPTWSDVKLKSSYMFKNHLKVAWRIIMRNKAYSFINVLGLALGLSACIIIYVITAYELSFDRFHPDGDRIYRIVGELGMPNGEKEFLNSPIAEVAGFQYAIPGFEAKAALHFYNGKVSITNGEKNLTVFNGGNELVITEPQYFNIFKYQWLAGNANSALNEPNQIVLTESKAHRYFGNIPYDEMIGKIIIYENALQLSVTGVVKDWQQNTDLGYTAFMSIRSIQNGFLKNRITSDDWKSLSEHQTMAFVKLAKNATPDQVNSEFAAYIRKNLKLPAGAKLTMQLQPISDLHFAKDFRRGDDGDNFRKAYMPVLYTLMGIALFILLLATMNFINLSTAQSIRRAREIGIRKVIGGSKRAIILQFLTETFLLTLFATLAAVVLIKPLFYLFTSFIPPGAKFDLLNGSTLIFLVLIAILTTIIAGFYPARILAAYLPVVSLKGMAVPKGSIKWNLRKTLIVFQFVISILFIIGAIVIRSQIKFMDNTNKGFKTDAIITMNNWDATYDKLKVFAENIGQIPGVKKVILQGNAPMGFAHSDDHYSYKGKEETSYKVSVEVGDPDFIPFYQMKIVAGRNLLHTDSLKELVINETFSRQLGFKQPEDAIGKMLTNSSHKSYPVVGVVADFHEGSFHELIQPVVITNEPARSLSVAVKLATTDMQTPDAQAIIPHMEADWKKLFPDTPFVYSFLDDSIKLLYQQEQNMALLVNVAMTIAILISCLGLFGLIMFTAQLKTKEIGIRKILGASVTNLTSLLTKEFIQLVIISILIASPIAWYFMNRWLQDFAYRIQLSIWVFLEAGMSAIIITGVVVGYQSVKAALANPVNSLRSE